MTDYAVTSGYGDKHVDLNTLGPFRSEIGLALTHNSSTVGRTKKAVLKK
ncbi:MAG: hypothetical protein QXM22_03365 [Candidatus Bathyarchaeia archaeon]